MSTVTEFSPELGIDFMPGDSILACVSDSQGFRSGTAVSLLD